MGLIVSYLPEPETHPLWAGIRGLLKPAAVYGEIPIYDEGELVWIAFDGPTLFAAGTTILWEDGEAEIRLCGGHRHKDWVKQAEGLVSTWARNCGATKLTMRGRRGWARYFAHCGWVVLGTEGGRTLYEKVL